MQKEQNKNELYWSVEQTAQNLRIAKSTVYALCRTKGFPSVRISPRRIVIPVQALNEWMKQRIDFEV